MESNLPPGFEDPANDDDIHEMAEMPFVEEIINDESFMDWLIRVNQCKHFIPYDTHDIIVSLNNQEIIEPEWKIDYYKSEEKRKADSKLHQKVKEIYGGTQSMHDIFNKFMKTISNRKI